MGTLSGNKKALYGERAIAQSARLPSHLPEYARHKSHVLPDLAP
jgi:hypothetical protein